jgi:hypothetical protein
MTSLLFALFLAPAAVSGVDCSPPPPGAEISALSAPLAREARFEGYRYNTNVLAGMLAGTELDVATVIRAAKPLDDGNRYLNRSELAAAISTLAGEEESIELYDLTPEAARAELSRRFPNVDLDALLDEAKEVVENREGTLEQPLRFGSLTKLADGRWDITIDGTFDYEGTDFSFYATFEGNDAEGFTLTDSGAD